MTRTARTLLLALLVISPPSPASTDPEPATKAAGKVMQTIDLVESKLKVTKYKHKTQVNLKQGKFYWDCSGMVDWILQKSAPKARKALPEGRPLAKHFYNVIAASPTDKPKKGWIRLESPEQIAPGDLFAWLKPTFWKKRKNTGHVGFVIEKPEPHPVYSSIWLMRIADSTRYNHEDDSRPADGTGGYGTGTIAFMFDESDSPIAYGWYGSLQNPQSYVPTKIVFGRVVK